jgi:hypothetical protein
VKASRLSPVRRSVNLECQLFAAAFSFSSGSNRIAIRCPLFSSRNGSLSQSAVSVQQLNDFTVRWLVALKTSQADSDGENVRGSVRPALN